MNERIIELAKQAQLEHCVSHVRLEDFANRIIMECINVAHSVSELRGVNEDMVYGADTAALKISKHFGV